MNLTKMTSTGRKAFQRASVHWIVKSATKKTLSAIVLQMSILSTTLETSGYSRNAENMMSFQNSRRLRLPAACRSSGVESCLHKQSQP